ncbi:FACT complex subunit ssrp1 [Aphanomyces cochlioides]|nr:FACT complex subunit ssrp1 [Aphanomyces cochlioides]
MSLKEAVTDSTISTTLTVTTTTATEVTETTAMGLEESIKAENAVPLCDMIMECFAKEGVDEEHQWGQTILFLEDALSIAKHRHEAAARAKSADVSGNALVTLTKVNTVVPKGKALDLVFGETDLVVQGKDFNITIPYSNIEAMLKLPKYEALAKLSVQEYQFVVTLKAPVTHRKNRLTCISFVIGGTTEQSDSNIVFHVDESERDFKSKKLHHVAEALLHSLTDLNVIKTYPEVAGKRYVSTNGAPFVKCYRRTSPGVLFFLPEGLCFLNPPVFLSRQTIDSISWSRETSEALRTFDVTVEMIDGTKVEFSMLEKEEIPSITEFVAYFGTLRDEDDGVQRDPSTEPTKKTKPTEKNTNSNSNTNANAEDDDDEEADSDFEMNDSDDDESEDEWVGSESLSDDMDTGGVETDSDDDGDGNHSGDDDEDDDME